MQFCGQISINKSDNNGKFDFISHTKRSFLSQMKQVLVMIICHYKAAEKTHSSLWLQML